MSLLAGSLLGILEEAGSAVLIMTEGLEAEEFFASRITRQEVQRHIQVMAETSANVPLPLKEQLIEIDWVGWTMLAEQLRMMGGFEQDALWFGVRSLVPATLMWLRVYRHNSPQLFSLLS